MVFDINSLPQIALIRSLNCQNVRLSNLDPDLNIPSQSSFQYYITDDFRNSDLIISCTTNDYFSVLHSNIRSLNSDFDKF